MRLLRSPMQEKFKAEPMKMRTVTPGGTSQAFQHLDTPIVEKQAGNTSSIRKASTVTTTTISNWFILIDDDEKWNNRRQRTTIRRTLAQQISSFSQLQMQNVDHVVQKSQPRELPRQVSQNKTDTETCSVTFFALFLLISYMLFQVPIVHSLIFGFYRSVFAQNHSLFKHKST